MKIAVIGTGYVGLVTGTCFAESGNTVTCVDVDPAKVETLRAGGIPIYEPGLEELVRRNVKERRLAFTTSHAEALPGADVAFIAVGTPPGETGEADLQYVLAAARSIGQHLTGPCVVVNKSTVPVGSADKVRAALEEVTRHPVEVVSNPEFLKEGAAIDDFMRPDRIVVGADSERARAVMGELYAPFTRAEQPVLYMDLRSAELTKYAANAMLATRISFMNEVAALCERLGADVDAVRRGLGSDRRIGHPFLHAGVGFGGSCLVGEETVLVRSARRVRLVALRDLYEALLGDDPDAEVIHPRDLEILSWDPAAGPRYLPVAAATRRHVEGEVVTVSTKMGRRVTCTPDHPLVVSDKGGRAFSVKPAGEVDATDWLPVVQGAEQQDAPPRTLSLLAAADVAGLAAANLLVHPGEAGAARLEALGTDGLATALAPLAHPRGRERVHDVLRTGSLRLHEARAAGVPLEGARLSSAKNGTRLPAGLVADEAFWRVVGLYLAEGHCSADGDRRRLFWSFHPTRETALVEEVRRYWEDRGVKVSVRRGTTALDVSVSSRLLAAFFLEVLDVGADCYEHRLPDLVWSEPTSRKRALLQGLWLGDGSWSLVNGGPSAVLEWGTASPALADGVVRLLGDLGVMARVKVGRTAKSTVDTTWVVVAGADQLERLLDLVKPSDRPGLRATLARQAKRIAPTGCSRVPGAGLVRVTGVERVPHRGYVYSLEVPGPETFVTTGGLVVHNCFPKDISALVRTARDEGLDFDLLRAVERVNERQKRSLVSKAVKHFGGSVAGKVFGVWGLAFKPKTDDMREAPSLTVIEGLVGNGARVKAFDPVAHEVASRLLHGTVELVEEPYAAAEGADALVLVTEWNEFRQPDWGRLRTIMRGTALFDGRNAWDAHKARAAGFSYVGVGRP
jgi:UDPglucose 6-dehydrogenase